jgi:WhiB family transcriptional regulator, redox-sensing transcriptional regulator
MCVIEPRREGRLSQPPCSGEGRNTRDEVTGRCDQAAGAATGAAGSLAALSDAALYAAASAGWMQFGACQEEDPELFFPIGPRGPAASQADAAKAVCGRCAVRRECLSYALRNRQEDGIWGGTTREERWAIGAAAWQVPAQADGDATSSSSLAPGRPARQRPGITVSGQVHPFAALLDVLTGGPS